MPTTFKILHEMGAWYSGAPIFTIDLPMGLVTFAVANGQPPAASDGGEPWYAVHPLVNGTWGHTLPAVHVRGYLAAQLAAAQTAVATRHPWVLIDEHGNREAFAVGTCSWYGKPRDVLLRVGFGRPMGDQDFWPVGSPERFGVVSLPELTFEQRSRHDAWLEAEEKAVAAEAHARHAKAWAEQLRAEADAARAAGRERPDPSPEQDGGLDA